MQQALRLAGAFARTNEPILLLGERGTGKTTLARIVHGLSARSGAFVPFQILPVNDDLYVAELFGHARGAYTGATNDKPGLVEAAERGTLFLDEFGHASQAMQRSLLGLLDGTGFRRLGENRWRPMGTRVVAATNADLNQLVIEGLFQRDLLDRIGYLMITVPPLRNRKEDILPLFSRFLGRRSQPDRSVTLGDDVAEFLLNHPWPGNVRQLEKVAAYVAVVMERDEGVVRLVHLPQPLMLGSTVQLPLRRTDSDVAHALAISNGNVSEAARMLRINRKTIQRRMNRPAPIPLTPPMP